MLNVAPCSCSSKLSLYSDKCPDSGNEALPSGNGEETNYNPLLEGEDNGEGLIQLKIGVYWILWTQRNKQSLKLSWILSLLFF